jgi:O-antigen/teichoic acid export membrane protein
VSIVSRSTGVAILGVSAASVLGVVLAFVSNLLVARWLPSEEFGAIRVLTAFVATLVGISLFGFHDALAGGLARQSSADRHGRLFGSAILCVLAISVPVAGAGMLLLPTVLKTSVVSVTMGMFVVACVPLIALSQLFSASLQSVGMVRQSAVLQIEVNAIPALLLAGGVYVGGLSGWLIARGLSAAGCVLAAWRYVAAIVLPFRWGRPDIWQLWGFSRIQFISGVLSLALSAGDVLIVRFVVNDYQTVGVYALAALVPRGIAFLPAAVGKVFFRDMAQLGDGATYVRMRFLVCNSFLAVGAAVVLASFGPAAVRLVYGESYPGIDVALLVWSVGVIGLFHWQGISLINIAVGKANRSVHMAAAGVLVGVPALAVLAHYQGAVGASIGMAVAYWVGALVGTMNAVSDGLVVRSR